MSALPMAHTGPMSDDISRLERWVAHGGTCRIVESDAHRRTVVLCRCDGGEEVERFVTTDSAVVAWVEAHTA